MQVDIPTHLTSPKYFYPDSEKSWVDYSTLKAFDRNQSKDYCPSAKLLIENIRVLEYKERAWQYKCQANPRKFPEE